MFRSPADKWKQYNCVQGIAIAAVALALALAGRFLLVAYLTVPAAVIALSVVSMVSSCAISSAIPFFKKYTTRFRLGWALGVAGCALLAAPICLTAFLAMFPLPEGGAANFDSGLYPVGLLLSSSLPSILLITIGQILMSSKDISNEEPD